MRRRACCSRWRAGSTPSRHRRRRCDGPCLLAACLPACLPVRRAMRATLRGCAGRDPGRLTEPLPDPPPASCRPSSAIVCPCWQRAHGPTPLGPPPPPPAARRRERGCRRRGWLQVRRRLRTRWHPPRRRADHLFVAGDTAPSITIKSRVAVAGGTLTRFTHDSVATQTPMTAAVYIPPGVEYSAQVPDRVCRQCDEIANSATHKMDDYTEQHSA